MNRFKNIQRLSAMLSRSYMAGNSNILKLKDRGLLKEVFPNDKNFDVEKLLISSKQTLYCGFDATADSLHLGNLVSIMVLLHCQRGGHNVIALLGGTTALIGDPSDKLTERPPLRPDIIHSNLEGIKEDIIRIFNNYQKYFHINKIKELPPVKVLDNRDWYNNIKVADFIGTAGRFFRMGDMLAKTHVKKRLDSEEGLCLAEFTYPIFQAYDWLHLFRKHGCHFQIGGSDQKGNILSGYDFLRKQEKKEFYGLTTPLITNSAGDKLGKSAGNVLYLNPKKTSPFELYQYFMRLADSEVGSYLKLFTFFSDEEIYTILSRMKTEPEKRHAHKTVAKEVVKLVHGEEGLKSAITCTDALYNMSLAKLSGLKKEEIKAMFEGASSCTLMFDPGMKVIDVAMKARCFKNQNDAERVIKAGGFQINSIKVTEPELALIPGQHVLRNNFSVIKIGKKHYYIVQWTDVDQEVKLFD